jgi:hypothetical protein
LAIIQKKQEEEEATASPSKTPMLSRIFRAYVAPQGTVYRDAVRDLMTQESQARLEKAKKDAEAAASPKEEPAHPLATAEEEQIAQQLEAASLENLEWDTGLLLLIPLRPGLNGINEDYAKSIAHTFSLPQSVGVLGGRPRGARWYVLLISLDSIISFHQQCTCFFTNICVYIFVDILLVLLLFS